MRYLSLIIIAAFAVPTISQPSLAANDNNNPSSQVDFSGNTELTPQPCPLGGPCPLGYPCPGGDCVADQGLLPCGLEYCIGKGCFARSYGTEFREKCFDYKFGMTNIYQQNMHGGLSTHRKAGRFEGSYDLELGFNLEKLLGIKEAGFFVNTTGNYSKSPGIQNPAVGSYFNVNNDAGQREAIYVNKFWYEQCFLNEDLRVRLGKMSLDGNFEYLGAPVGFEKNIYAQSENYQFLNSVFVKNPSIPFPSDSLAASLIYNIQNKLYLAIGAADAQSNSRTTALKTPFDGNNTFFYIAECGFCSSYCTKAKPMHGLQRFGFWVDDQDKEYLDGSGRVENNDMGFYYSGEQMIYKEKADPANNEGLGLFFRYGWADSKVNKVNEFWSLGCQYKGLIDCRDEDVLGIGFANGTFSDHDATFTEDYERVWEMYYRIQINDWTHLSPSLQYVSNPGGNGTRDALVFGLRSNIAF